jgi:hypothetical protein
VILSPSFKIPIQKEDSQKCNEVNVWLQKWTLLFHEYFGNQIQQKAKC